MVTKNRFVIVFQAVFVVIFTFGLLFPAGMVVRAQDVVPPAETTTDSSVPDSGSGDTSAPAAPADPAPAAPADPAPVAPVEPAPVVEVPAVEPAATEAPVEAAPADVVLPVATEVPAVEVVPVVDPAIVPTEDPLLAPALPAPVVEESTAAIDTPAEVIEALPEQADLVVLDENGEAVPLVTVEAADAIVSGDPMWCPGTTAAGDASCQEFSTIEKAIAYAKQDGHGECTIYVAENYHTTSKTTIVIDEDDFNMNGFNMFLVGGVDLSSTSSATYGQVIGQTSLNQYFLIDDITGSFTLANFIINEFKKNTSNESSVYISDSKNVTLKNLSITNAGDGSGIRVANSKDVKIEDSAVKDFKSGNAIKITDSADIMIMNTKAHDYDHDSAIYLYNDKAVELKGVTAKSDDSNGLFSEFGKDYLSIIDSFFNYNDGYGILVSDMNGWVSLDNVEANFNDDGGVKIETKLNHDSGVTIKGGSISHNDGEYGLSVKSETIELGKGLQVNSNKKNGASLWAHQWIDLETASFNGNHHGYGLHATAEHKYIFIDGIEANENGTYGALLEAKSDLTLKNGFFDRNDQEGLTATTADGEMLLSIVSASGNGWGDKHGYGMHLMSDGAMNLDALTVVGNFNEGLKAESDETMNITKSHFDNNGWGKYFHPYCGDGYGADLFSKSDLTIVDSSFDNNFNDGLIAEAGSGIGQVYPTLDSFGLPFPYPHPIIGNITLENVTANNNGYKFESSKETKEDANGANLKTNGNLTITGSEFNGNYNSGLYADAAGKIRVESSQVNKNEGWEKGDFGAIFQGKSSIDLLNSTFDMNWGPGLQVYVLGAINVDGVSASDNMSWEGYYPGYGAVLDTKFGGVTIANSFFNDNEGFGLFVWSNDDVTVKKTEVNNNDYGWFWDGPVYAEVVMLGSGPVFGPPYDLSDYNGDGAFIHSEFGSVTINNSQFNGNEEHGLSVEAWKDITLDKVEVIGNGDDGAKLRAHGNITVSCSKFIDNGDYGLKAGATGLNSAVTLNSNTFSGNGDGDYDIWAGELTENLNYPCGSNGGGGGGTAGGGGGPAFGLNPLVGVIPVTGGEFMALSCTGISVLQLPDGEETIFNQPMCGYLASMELVTPEDLPGQIPAEWKFVDGFTVTLMFGNEVVNNLPVGATDTLVFPLSKEQASGSFHILFWDVTANGGLGDWIDLGGVKEALKWTKTHDQTGTFILVE